jgi:23S rRNA pseudouridine2605 synthase
MPRKPHDPSPAPRGGELRLQAYLARAGIASRRASEELIAAGRVKVNGAVVSAPGSKVRPGHDSVAVDGSPVEQVGVTWLALHKPRGYVTTRSDPYGRRTVYELIPEKYHSLFHVGRLDRDSEGLLLLTNDGEMANRMLHPSFGTTKEYLADVEGQPESATISALLNGVELEDGVAKAEEVQRLHQTGPDTYRLRIVLREGKKREIRRMMDAVGHPVHRLMRRRFGPVDLGELPSGKFRVLGPSELSRIREGAVPRRKKAATSDEMDTQPGIEQPRERKSSPARPSAERHPAKAAAARSTTRTDRPSRAASDDRPARPGRPSAAKSGARTDGRPARPEKRFGDERPTRSARPAASANGRDEKRRGPKTGREAGTGAFDKFFKAPRKAGSTSRARPEAGEAPRRTEHPARTAADEWEDSGKPVRRPPAGRGRWEDSDRPQRGGKDRAARPGGAGARPKRDEPGGEGRPQRTSRPGAPKRAEGGAGADRRPRRDDAAGEGRPQRPSRPGRPSGPGRKGGEDARSSRPERPAGERRGPGARFGRDEERSPARKTSDRPESAGRPDAPRPSRPGATRSDEGPRRPPAKGGGAKPGGARGGPPRGRSGPAKGGSPRGRGGPPKGRGRT